jgi:P27 family predicted phage terminase small subunit
MVNPPVPLPLRVLRGNPGKRRLGREPELPREPECPAPPDFVAPYGQDEWWRVAPELHRLGLLTVGDVMPLAAYCQAYARWRLAEEALARMTGRDESDGLLVKSATGDARPNPLVRLSSDAAAAMLRYAAEFGLTPVARTRLAAGVRTQPPGRFDGLLGPFE